MTTLKRCLLVALILQIGCVALDHSISELEYEEDDLRLLVGNSYATDALHSVEEPTADDNESGSDIILFHPKFYDFKESPVGMPRLGVVQIDNRLKDETVKLISVSGNTVNFHSSFFANKVLSPGNFTSFEVVFLSREEGEFNSVLHIHTSKGLFKYHVRGVGLPNPYRLRPLVGARIPVNASYEPIITLHNPHDTRILVVEMLSSGTDFGLKLPDATDEQEGTAWAIEPFQTKPVMQGSFQGKTEGNHTGFIRIKVNHTTIAGEYLMVPVEVQVSSSPGIYSPQESLDFGLLVRSDKPKTLSLNLINAQPTFANVQSVIVKGESNPAIRIEFRPLIIEPDTSSSTVVALITFDPSQLSSVEQSNGFIEVRSECGKSISIPFHAIVIEGQLEYNSSSLGFSINTDSAQARNFSVRNQFSSAVAIYQVSVNHPEIVQVDTLNQSHVINPGEQKTICTLKIQRKVALCDSKSSVQLTVKSNITNLKLPITCYDGKLQLYSVENGQVDFGRVELYSTYTEYIAVQNKNPIEVRLKSWGSNSSWSQVELVGMQKGVMEDLSLIRDFDNMKKSLFLQPGHMAVFSIDIRRPTVEGMFYGESYVTTDQNQTLRAPFRFLVSKGSVSSETIFFDKTFPGKLSFEKLYLTSTFNHTLNLVGLRSYPLSAVWFSSSTLQGYPEISPHRRSFVGKVHFDPRKFCMQDCYTGFGLDTALGKNWLRGVVLNWETGDIDLRIWETLQARFNQIKDEIVSNMSLWVDTNGPTGFKIKSKVRYMWPRLSLQKSVVFPLTALGNETFLDVVIQNPSNSPVVFQAAMAQDYGASWTNFVMGNTVGGNSTEGGLVISVKDISWPSSQFNGSGIVDIRKKLQKLLPATKEDLPGLLFVLPATSKVSLSLRFAPLSKEMSSSLLLLRNNLTGMETVWVRGRAGTGQLTVGNGTPGSSLLFQLTESLLQGCEKEEMTGSSKYTPPQVTVRRSFIARNIGEIPLEILSLVVFPQQESFWSWALGTEVDGDACEGYGFRILNCHPFTLQPNQTHSIDIAFTPDFTLSKVRATLLLTDSSGGFFNYTLVALIPSNMLAKCAAALVRPWWEWYLKVGAVIGSVVIFLAGSFVLYFEASGVISKTVLATVRVLPRGANAENSQDERDKAQRLDLKAVYDKVENRFKKHQDTHKAQAASTSSQGNKTPKGNDLQPSNLRNRKGKKIDLNSSQNSINNKLSEKGNNANNVVGRNHNQMGAVEEVVATYMNVKKDKENIVASSGNNNNRKKKGANNHQQNSQSGTAKKLHSNKNDGFHPSSLPNTKTEEETSSTTTESSNPDDVNLPYYESYDKKTKGNYGHNNTKHHNTRRDKKHDSSSNENITNFDPSSEKSFDDKKKSYMKKRESAESASSVSAENKRSNNISPRQDMSLWDTPRPPSGDGFSELVAQTEAFVMQRPSRRNRSGEDGQGNGRCVDEHLIYAPKTICSAFQMTQNFVNPQRPKKPGVIGQPRSTSSASQHPQGNFGSHSHSSSPPIRNAGYNNYNSYSSTGMPRQPVASPSGSIWDSDILPDNGCDVWGRRSFDKNYFGLPTDGTFTRATNTGFGVAGNQNGFGQSTPTTNSTSGGTSFVSSGADPHYSFPTNRPSQAGNFPLVSVNGPSMNVNSAYRSRNSRDSSYLVGNGGFSNELTTTNPWQINPPSYNESAQYRSQQNIVNGGNPPTGMSTTTTTNTTGPSQHGYLHRMRSDPTLRSQQPPTSSPSSRPAWIETIFAEHESKRRESEERERNSWLTPSQLNSTSATAAATANGIGSSGEASFEKWRAVGPTGARMTPQESQIWESSAVGSQRWPTSYGSTTLQSSYSDTMAVGSATRLPFTSRQEEQNSGIASRDLGLRAPNSDITREVEAGLGFNPFTSNIWNQSEGSSWGTSGTGSSYPYSQNK